jgi:hypothetical protein
LGTEFGLSFCFHSTTLSTALENFDALATLGPKYSDPPTLTLERFWRVFKKEMNQPYAPDDLIMQSWLWAPQMQSFENAIHTASAIVMQEQRVQQNE